MSKTTETKQTEIAIHFGAMCDTIAEQLAGQVERLPAAHTLEHLQRDAEAITRLRVRSVLTDGEASRARQRLMKQIREAVPDAR